MNFDMLLENKAKQTVYKKARQLKQQQKQPLHRNVGLTALRYIFLINFRSC